MTEMREFGDISLATPRLELREFQASDQDAIQAYAGDTEVTRFTSWGPNTPDMTAAVLHTWLQEKNKTPRVEWPVAIVRRGDGVLIGGTGLSGVDWSTGTAEFGYVLLRSAWGCGFATEASSAVTDWAFGYLRLKSLIAHCEPLNGVSLRVLNKLGFCHQEGLIEFEKANGDKRTFLALVRARPE